jgi:TIR domain
MEQVEKTVFISYRQTNIVWALAIFKDLEHHGYDVFFDFSGIAGGDFEQVILGNIRARAHFLVLHTPSALERCSDRDDWLRREIETALDRNRNIVPLFLEGFDFGNSKIASQLTGRLAELKRYNGLTIPPEYFDAAMEKLRRYLNVPLSAVLHPLSATAQRAAIEQKATASAAPQVQAEDLETSPNDLGEQTRRTNPESERLVQQRTEQEVRQQEKTEIWRRWSETAEAERKRRLLEKANAERLAQERAEQQRHEQQKAEAERAAGSGTASDVNNFIVDRLNAALNKIDAFENISGPPPRHSFREAIVELRDEVIARAVVSPSLELDAIAHSLIGLTSGRRVAEAVAAREFHGNEKYETEDPGWLKCLLEYVSSRPVDFPVAPVGSAIYPLQGSDDIRIALAGDWGTYNPPAVLIAGHIKAANPDYSIHLGGVYYAGDPKDEIRNLVDLWPAGRFGTLAMNSCHEMYCGGVGYFEAIKKQKFANQGFSYFALHNTDWLIIGLDTAYWANNQSFLYEDGYISEYSSRPKGTAQRDWVVDLLSNPQHARKRLIILTHHDGFDVNVGKAKEKHLFQVITDLIGNSRDCLWYWGHVHAGIAYKPIQRAENMFLRARCVGHGGVPSPPFSLKLSAYGTRRYSIDWAEQEKAITGDRRRALNGYMMLTLSGKRITEEFYDENGNRRPWLGTS